MPCGHQGQDGLGMTLRVSILHVNELVIALWGPIFMYRIKLTPSSSTDLMMQASGEQ